MNRPITHARLRALADRCETAAHKRCKCRCGGALHGTKHGDEWIAEEVQRDRLRCQQIPGQTDWVGFAGFEHLLV